MVWRAVMLVSVLGVMSCAPGSPGSEGQPELELGQVLRSDATGYARATEPQPFRFPGDHGPHPEFRTEWWYFTGNLITSAGRRFGFHLTFFRNALTPEPAQRESKWATAQLYMAHFAVADVAGGETHEAERFSRASLGLAGARAEPFAVWLLDWRAASADPSQGLFPLRLSARDGEVAIDLELVDEKPLVLQGDQGLSRKSAEVGNASYYYSFTRLAASGSVEVDGAEHTVTGTAWCDREWSTSALGRDQVGWDWFALQLDDGSDLMIYRLRRADGEASPFSRGTWVAPDGPATRLDGDEIRFEVTDTWLSPRSGARYPAGFRVGVPSANLELTVEPWLADQELALSVRYWEGAVRVTGRRAGRDVSGHGYVELTGY